MGANLFEELSPSTAGGFSIKAKAALSWDNPKQWLSDGSTCIDPCYLLMRAFLKPLLCALAATGDT